MKSAVELNGNGYKISGSARSNSVVSMVSEVKASFSSKGKISDNRLVPANHNIKFKNGRKTRRLKMSFTPDGVDSIQAKPKIKYKSGAVPVEKSHLKEVLDPISSMLLPVKADEIGNGRKICNRTVPIFDGRARINLVFSYRYTGSANIKGFRGNTIICAARYQPIAGIRPHHRNIKFMKANRDMQVTLARIGDSNYYTMMGFRVRTSKGLASAAAYEFTTR